MDKNLEIFNLQTKLENIKEIEKTHPHIISKLILDAVNGVGVVAKDLHDVNKSKQTLLIRTTEGILGNSKKRQDLINENLIEGIHACVGLFKEHNEHFSRVEEKITAVANILIKTRNKVSEYCKEHQKLKNSVEEIKHVISEFIELSNRRFDSLCKDVTYLKAMNVLNEEIEKLENNEYNHLAVPLQIYTILDNFKSGDGGIYYDSLSNDIEKEDFQEKIKRKLFINFKNRCDLKELLNYEQLSQNIIECSSIQKEALSFISTQHYNELLEKGFYPEVADLISVLSTYDTNKSMQELEKQSNIRTFFTYEEYIATALDEHLKV